MGMFSWMTMDTNKSIPAKGSSRKPLTVYLLDNKGNKRREDEYEGYGKFGGKDFYELLAEMNGLTTRGEGITLSFSGKQHLSPNLVEDPTTEWVGVEPDVCPDQGFFY